MLNWDDDELIAAGLDPVQVKSIVRRLRRLSKEMASVGLKVYGAAGAGNLVHASRSTHGDSNGQAADYGSIIADLGYTFDGGDW